MHTRTWRSLLAASLALLLAAPALAEEVTPPPPPPTEPEAAAAPAPASASAPQPKSEEISKVTLRDGQILRGRVVEKTSQAVTLELISGGKMSLPTETVREVEVEKDAKIAENGQIWNADPNRTRYLYGPSAMRLRRGEGYFSQKELFFSAVAFGVTDNISVLAGSVLPLFLAGTGGANVIGGVKVGFSLHENLHLAAGAESLVLPSLLGNSSGPAAAGFVFGAATVGNPNMHATLAIGRPFSIFGSANVGEAIVTLSGNLRIHQNLALVTENWFFPTYQPISSEPMLMLNGLGVRIMGEHIAVDIGGIRIPGTFVPMPWLDFTYNFG